MNKQVGRTENLGSTQDPTLLCVLLLDTSRALSGQPVAALKGGLVTLRDRLERDAVARRRVEIAVVSFGGAPQVLCTPSPVKQFNIPDLVAGGPGKLNPGLTAALAVTQHRSAEHRALGTPFFRPWIVTVAGGAPADDWRPAARTVAAEEERGGVVCFGVGLSDAAMPALSEVSRQRPPLQLQGLKFRDLFLWLAEGQTRLVHSRPGDPIVLDIPTWARAAF